MAIAFKNAQVALTSTAQTTLYTAPAATQSVVFSLIAANVDGVNSCTLTVEVTDTSAAVTRKVAYLHPVPGGGSWYLDKPLVLEATDVLKVTAGTANDLEVVAGILEKT